MSTLNAAFVHADLIFGIYVAIILASGLLARAGNRRSAMAIAVVNHGGLIGLATTLAMPFISPFAVEPVQLFTAVFIEIFCAAIFAMASWQIIAFLRSRAQLVPDRFVLLLVLAKLLFFLVNYSAAGGQYGIFSDDSRIDFLMISPMLARTLYLDMLIDFTVFLSIGLRCVSQREVRWADLLGVLAIICLTFLTGSKGASFLMLGYVSLYIYAAFPRMLALVPSWALAVAAAIAAAAVFGYIYVLSEILQTLSRFLLSADARIMAFDPNVNAFVLSQSHGTFLSELFRGPARMLGFPAAEFPIGVYQYQFQVATNNYVGSTNQLSAMFVIYGGNFWLVELLVVGGVMLFAYKLLQRTIKGRNPAVAWVSAASFFWLSDTLCKGFDAFVQLLPICLLVIFALTILRRFRWGPRRLQRPAPRGDNGIVAGTP
jgi:hypothetical protein